MGGLNEDRALDMVVDNNNYIYITGYFRDTVDLDPGIGIATFISEPFDDRFLAKYDANGNYVWAKDFCDNDSSRVIINKVAIDKISNFIYIVGFFRNTIDFDRGAGTFLLSSSGAQDNDGFLSKYDTAGNFIWGGSISGNWYQAITAIEINKTGNGEITVAGGFGGMTDFDLGTGVLNVTASGNIFNGELFFAKYDGAGNNLWIKNVGNGTSHENIVSIQTDSYGNYLIAGSFDDVLDFDPDIGNYNLTSTGSGSLPDIYFAKYDNSFNFLWAENIGGPDRDTPLSMALDNQNNIILTGYFTNSIDADPDAGVVLLNPAQSQNIFIGKYANTFTGIFDGEKYVTSSLVIYPNPATFNAAINGMVTSIPPNEAYNIKTISPDGAVVYNANGKGHTFAFNASFPPGVYFVNVKSKSYNGFKKLVVVK